MVCVLLSITMSNQVTFLTKDPLVLSLMLAYNPLVSMPTGLTYHDSQ